jgi:hypothetical protein
LRATFINCAQRSTFHSGAKKQQQQINIHRKKQIEAKKRGNPSFSFFLYFIFSFNFPCFLPNLFFRSNLIFLRGIV